MRKRALISVLFPIVVMAAWTTELTYRDRTGTVVDLAVEPFDPRDLLSGQYLQYRVVYQGEKPCAHGELGPARTECVCLDAKPAGQVSTVTWTGACPRRPESCTVFLKGECRHGFFSAGIERFYFAEYFSEELRQAPKNSTIRLKVNARGGGLVTQFLVDNVPLSDWLKEPR